MSLRRTVAAAVAVATLTLASPSRADLPAATSPWVLRPGEFYSEITGSLFSARSFHDNDRERPPLDGKLDERELMSWNELGWKPRASVWIGIPLVNRGFTRLTAPLGANRKLFPGSDGDGGTDPSRYPPYSLSNAADTSLYFNQGLQSLRVGVDFGGHAWKHAFWTAGGTYRYRFLEFLQTGGSSHNARFVEANASLGWWAKKSLLVSGLFSGEWSMNQSANYDQDLTLDREPMRLLAGPRLTWRVDERMDVIAGSWHVVRGQNVLHYDQYYFGIAWRQSGLSRYAGAYGGTSETDAPVKGGAPKAKH
jgi:hypothetical protein